MIFSTLETPPENHIEELKPHLEEASITQKVASQAVDELSELLSAVSLKTPVKAPVAVVSTTPRVDSTQGPPLTDLLESEVRSVSDASVPSSEVKPQSPGKEQVGETILNSETVSETAAGETGVRSGSVGSEADNTSNKIDITNTVVGTSGEAKAPEVSSSQPTVKEASWTGDSEIELNVNGTSAIAESVTKGTGSSGLSEGTASSNKPEDGTDVVTVDGGNYFFIVGSVLFIG